MATAHRANAHAEAEALLRRHGYPKAQVIVVRSPGDSVDGCLTIFFLTRKGLPYVALVRGENSKSKVEVEIEPW